MSKRTKYRVFHETDVYTNEDGSTITDIRPYDLRDRSLESAIAKAKTLRHGNVRRKGSSTVVWHQGMEEAA